MYETPGAYRRALNRLVLIAVALLATAAVLMASGVASWR